MISIRTLAALPLVAACATEPPLEPWDDPGTSEQVLGYDVMPELEILLEPDAIDALAVEPRVYVPGTLVYEGRSFGPVGVRLKGQNSFQPIHEKPSFRININEYIEDATFYGLKDMTLNNMASDPSMMHERLAYLVMREAGLPASRCNHALVTVNGEFYGLYANVETVKARMLGGHFDNNDGPLFEATDVDFAAEYVDLYELDAGPDDRTKLWGLAEALTIADPDAALAAASAYVDLDHFQRYWATGSVIGQFDAFPFSNPGDDYFIYADPQSDKLWFIPWGMDETFFAADFSPLDVSSVLARKCKDSPACFGAYVDQVWELVGMIEDLGLDEERGRVQDAITPHIERDARRPQSNAEVTEGQTQLGYFIRYRREALSTFLPPPGS